MDNPIIQPLFALLSTLITSTASILIAYVQSVKFGRTDHLPSEKVIHLPPGVQIARFQKPSVWRLISFVLLGIIMGTVLAYPVSNAFLAYNDSAVLQIEETSTTVLYYENASAELKDINQGYLAFSTYTEDRASRTSYKFYYDVSREGSYSGFDLEFGPPIDLSSYAFIEFKVWFDAPTTRFKLYIDDQSGLSDHVLLGDGSIIEAKRQEQTVRLPLKEFFPSVSLQSVKEITIDVNNLFSPVPSYFVISEIQFTK